jgi:hypothetical protein
MGKKKVLTKDEIVLIDRGFKHYKNGLWIKSTKKMSVDEWLGERQYGLGGSDIGTILGFNTFKTAVELFREKVGLNDAPKLETRHIYWGHEAESEILNVGQHYDFSVDVGPKTWSRAWCDNLYAGTKLRTITDFPNLCVNTKYPWLQANVDGLVNHDKRRRMAAKVAEAKNSQEFVCQQYNDWVNPSYIGQGLTYSKVLQPMLLVPGFEIYIKIDGNDLFAKNYTLSQFEWLVDDILNESFEFYNNMTKGVEIVKNATDRRQAVLGLREIEPGPDDTARYDKFISKEYFENLKFCTADLTDAEYLEKSGDDDEGGAIVGWHDEPENAPEDYKPVPVVIPEKMVKNMEQYIKARQLYSKKEASYKRKKALYTNTIKKFMSDYSVNEVKIDGGYARWKNKFTVNYK